MMLDAFREKSANLAGALQELGTLASDVGAKSLAERVGRDLVKKLQEDRFHLVVVGEFNHGKTSFVNALLGKQALPTGVTPTTATIHHIRYSEEPSATIVRTSGARDNLAFGEAKSFAVGGNHGSEDGVDFLEIGYPAPLLKEGILLVDTPGVNDLSLQRSDITYSYIPRADAVLFLLDAGQILKESERVFLQEKLLKASRDKIVFVITKWDILSTDERVEAFDYARTQLAKLVPNPVLFAVSAETHLSGDHEGSGFVPLLGHLTHFLAEERGRILLDNTLGEGLSVASLVQKGLDARRRSLAMNMEELDRRIAFIEQDLKGQAGTIEERRMRIREEIASVKMLARKDLEHFVETTMTKLPAVIDSAKREDLKKFLPSFLEDAFRQWAEAESKDIGGKLETLAEKTIAMVKEDATESAKRVATALGTEPRVLDVNVDTFRYDIGVVGLFAIGVSTLFVNLFMGVVLLAAAPLLAVFLKDKIDAEYKKRAKEAAPAVVRQAAEQIGPKLDEMIDDFGRKLEAWVVSAGEELHRELLEVLSAAKVARSSDAQTEAQARTWLDERGAKLDALKTDLETRRAALWTPVSTAIADDAAVGAAVDGPGAGA